MHVIEKPPLDGVYLAHFGVKGMKWGVINEDDSASTKKSSQKSEKASSRKFSREDYEKVPRKKLSPEEQKKALKKNEKKSAEKLEPPDGPAPKGRLSPGQKKALYIAAGAVAVAGIVGASYYANKKGLFNAKPKVNPDYDSFLSQVDAAKTNTWRGQGFLTKASYDRPEMTLKSGHTFTRYSKSPETGFGQITYTSMSDQDSTRYLAGGWGRMSRNMGVDLHEVKFTAASDVKVPSTKTALDTLKEVMSSGGKSVTPDDVVSKYNELSGSSWKDPVSTPFFDKLKSKGYHALVDEMDAGVQSDSPLLIFASENFSSKVSRLIDPREVDRARSIVQTLTNPKL